MATNLRFDGRSIPITATAAVASGALFETGDIVGIASTAAAIGETFELALTGVYEVPKAAAEVWTPGAQVYFDGTQATISNAGTTFMGHAYAATENPSATGLVRLCQA